MRTLATAVVVGMFLTSCGGAGGGTGLGNPPQGTLTFQQSVNGAPASQVPAQGSLDLSNIGDVGVITAFNGAQQVGFKLVPAASCSGIVTISPSSSSSMQQTVTAVSTGECTATAKGTDGATATLAIFAMPPP